MSILRKKVRNRQRSPLQAPHQLSMVFDTAELRRLTPAQRANALNKLVHLLLAAGGGVREADDDER